MPCFADLHWGGLVMRSVARRDPRLALARAGCPWHGPRVTHIPTSVIGFSGTDHEGGDDGALRGGVASTVEKERGSAHGGAAPPHRDARERWGARL